MKEFFDTPSFSNICSKQVVMDFQADEVSIRAMECLGFDVILSCPVNGLPLGLRGHPDLQIFYLGNRQVVTAPEVYSYYKKRLKDIEILCGNKVLNKEYPKDIPYNACQMGGAVFHDFRNSDPIMLSQIEQKNLKRIQVKQGYCKCSICTVSNQALITADAGIAKAALEYGFDVLKISPGHILLKGYSYGFIGGCTGLLEPKLLVVNGSLNTHPDGAQIKTFCNKHQTEIYELSTGPLQDIGSILPLYNS